MNGFRQAFPHTADCILCIYSGFIRIQRVVKFQLNNGNIILTGCADRLNTIQSSKNIFQRFDYIRDNIPGLLLPDTA